MTQGGSAPVPCPACGGTDFERGSIDDVSRGDVRWMAGEPRRSWRDRAVPRGRSTGVVALRCVQCSRLELYAR
ncbi:hypothetical protein SAMN05660199_02514 [Klenkia soli]|uniref:Uncharacterized protein n=1 Tax=Klenkia soli TaxID=1052260 RepID=A0A1H0M4C2_9ACTN|nr:hypothetical protein [Klenkia soli]SDO75066.1 hypothetical protein SAMN05660199_02514 [Klenkia soli]